MGTVNGVNLQNIDRRRLFSFLEMVYPDRVELCKSLGIETAQKKNYEKASDMAKRSLSPYIQGTEELNPAQWKKVEDIVRRNKSVFELYLKQIRLF